MEDPAEATLPREGRRRNHLKQPKIEAGNQQFSNHPHKELEENPTDVGSDGSERNFRSAFRNSFLKFWNETGLRSEFRPKLNENPELVPKLMERNEPRTEKFGTGPTTDFNH